MNGRWKKAQLRWRPSLLLLAVVLAVWACVGVHGEIRAKLVNNGYEDVVVAVSQNVKEEQGPALVEKLKEVLAETSRGLYKATGRRAYFRSVTILIPKSWTSVNVTHKAGSENFEDSDIRVDDMNPVYRQQPYTKQSGGCGDPGMYIHLTPTYLLDDAAASYWGPRDKMLLLEWAKLRWGVFDELGYPGDPRFPLFYRDSLERISVTHCADPRVRGRRMDRRNRKKCTLQRNGEPDDNCRFIPFIHQRTTSSLLSYPLIMNEKIINFCGGQHQEHNIEAPTKQNLYCELRSAWDVISDHKDFRNGANPSTENFGNLAVRVVQQADTSYTLVLDYSGSMGDRDRVNKLRRIARRWLLHEVATGSSVAIINFSSGARLIKKTTMITDDASRRGLADAIETNVSGGTSIGSGLRMAANTVLTNERNPVILLITDGQENENPRIDDVLNEVKASGARVVTVAFGKNADQKLEEVAEATGGKTFTVNDIDEGQMLEDAFQGALTYQPPPPAAAQTVPILDKEYTFGGSEASSTFDVDTTLGRNLTVRLETSDQVTSEPVLIDPEGHVYTDVIYSDSSSWTLMVPLAKEGKWTWKVGLSGQQSSRLRVRVISQPRDGNVQPIRTRAWVNQGAKEVNAALDKVVIIAEVKQGNKPVVNANVRAIVTPPNEHEPHQTYILLDNGQGADTLAGDGIYSRYMTKYSSSGRYSVRAEVSDGGTALINTGLHSTTRRRRRQAEENTEEKEEEMEYEDIIDDSLLELLIERPNVCCGSVIQVPEDAPSTGTFVRTASGGSVKIMNVPQGDFLAPSRVRDLQVQLVEVAEVFESFPAYTTVSLTWTAPGDDMDSGIVSDYELRMTTNRTQLLEENFIFNDISSNSSWRALNVSELLADVEGGTTVSVNFTLALTSPKTFFALRARDDALLESKVSNVAILYLDVTSAPAHTLMHTWILVAVALVVLCLLIVAAVLYLMRKKRKEKERLV